MTNDGGFGAPQYQEQPDPYATQAQAQPDPYAAQQNPYTTQAQGPAQAQFRPQDQNLPQYQAPPQGYAVPQYQAAGQVVLPKNPALGVILSFFIPGLGSMVNGDGARGAIILGVYVIGWVLALFLIGIPILFGAWVWGMVDGYLSAQRWNLAHGITS
jgi:TM2 domain-containing membrane protein YozV